jgi:hypothetical protein
MSMYVEVLSGALDTWAADLSEDALLDHVLACLLALPSATAASGQSANAQLAAEIAYDRALFKLAAHHGIDVAAQRFSRPQAERHRLEAELVRRGIDLKALIDQRRPVSWLIAGT